MPGPDGGAAVTGTRRRLAATGMDGDARELPTLGRISVTHGGCTVQVQLLRPLLLTGVCKCLMPAVLQGLTVSTMI